MENAEGPAQRTEPPGDRLSRLSAASLRINESLDVDAASQPVKMWRRTTASLPRRLRGRPVRIRRAGKDSIDDR